MGQKWQRELKHPKFKFQWTKDRKNFWKDLFNFDNKSMGLL